MKTLIMVAAMFLVPSQHSAKAEPFSSAALELQVENPVFRESLRLDQQSDRDQRFRIVPLEVGPVRIDYGAPNPADPSLRRSAPLLDSPGAGYREQLEKVHSSASSGKLPN